MSQLLGIKFNDYGQLYYFSSGAFVVGQGQSVLVKTEQGMGLGKVVLVKAGEEDEEHAARHETIYRLANEKDFEAQAENQELARAAFAFCRKCITDHELEMKLVDVEVFFDRSKMVFYFTAPGRIDFRELIKDLVKEYRTRIELRQIGVRHETQMLGALGNCGQICCCRRFLRKFVPVTIKMAKEQNLFLNPSKISGICGRLLCCLSYEQEGYEEFNRLCPKVGKRYSTARGPVRVLRSNFFRKTLTILPEGGPEEDISLEDWQELRKGAVPARIPAREGEAGQRPRSQARGNARRDSSQAGGRASGQASGQAPSQASGQAPSQASGQAPSQASGQAPSQASGQVPSQASGQAPSQDSSQDSGQDSGQNGEQGASQCGPIFGLSRPDAESGADQESGADDSSAGGGKRVHSSAKPGDGKQPPKGAKGSGRKPKRRRKRPRARKNSDSSS